MKQTRLTLKKINSELATYGLEVVKGAGYFYFDDIGTASRSYLIPSICSTLVSCMSLEAWVNHAIEYGFPQEDVVNKGNPQ